MNKSIILAVMMAFALCVSARAETDYQALAVIHDIQNGVDNANQIKTLRVKDGITLPAGAITSASIADGTIVNADIASGAAIAQSKLATLAITKSLLSGAGTVVSSTSYVGRVQVLLGSVTNGQAITFSPSFAASPAVVIGPEGSYTGAPYASSLTSGGFTAAGYSGGVAGGYIAIGISQ